MAEKEHKNHKEEEQDSREMEEGNSQRPHILRRERRARMETGRKRRNQERKSGMSRRRRPATWSLRKG
eukprot:759690-Hanusia_phi.AAC.2